MSKKRMPAMLLAAILLLAPVSGTGAEARNQTIWQRETALAPCMNLTTCIFQNGSRQTEHYITYLPNERIRPQVSFGETLNGRLTLPDAEALEERNGRVLGGINGDYFVMATGMPLGIVLRDGELLSSEAGNYAVGFRADGTAVYGKPGVRLSFRIGEENFRLLDVNKSMSRSTFCLYTPEWGEKTGADVAVWNIVLRPDPDAKLSLTGATNYTVEDVFASEGAVAFPEGCCVLCLTADSDEWRLRAIARLKGGDRLTVTAELTDERFADCTCAMGSLYPLLTDGTVTEDLDRKDNAKAPRTAIGIRADGSILLYTVDGRQSGYSVGLSLRETAERLLELGCVDAGAMDGGGSTALGAQIPGQETCSVQNSPSGGALREVPVYLLLTSEQNGSGEARTLAIRTETKVLLAGAKTGLTVSACDECGAPAAVAALKWSASAGSVNKEGVFTAPKSAGTVTVTVSEGETNGTLTLPVITSPDSVTLRGTDGKDASACILRPGEQLSFHASAVWRGLDVTAADSDFHWEVIGSIGTISKDGRFRAGEEDASGRIRVSAGDASAEIPIIVCTNAYVADDFETASAGSAAGLHWAGETLRDHVKIGFGSLKLEYDLSAGRAVFPMSDYPTELLPTAYLWVRSDGSENRLYGNFDQATLLLGVMDRAGWMMLTMEPGVYGKLQSLELRGSGSGTLWLDQLTLTDGSCDTEAPVIDLSADRIWVSASVSDREDGFLRGSALRLTLDGEELPFTYDAKRGTLTAATGISDGLPHRVTLFASDSSGNINSASVLLNGTEPGPFSDMEGHWAESYVTELAARNLVNGRSDGSGGFVFDPDSPINRAEFAVMLCRWLRVEPGQYGQELEKFADQEQIPEWAREGAAAAAALGLIQGSADGGKLYFRPQDTLTRAQAAVILGRTMQGGRMEADLPFADAGSIPDWAAPYISQLAFMGIMNGDGENFLPNGKLTRGQTAKLLSELG